MKPRYYPVSILTKTMSDQLKFFIDILKRHHITFEYIEISKNKNFKEYAQTPGCFLIDFQSIQYNFSVFFKDSKKISLTCPFLVFAKDIRISDAIALMKHGATNCLLPPFSEDIFLHNLQEASQLIYQHFKIKQLKDSFKKMTDNLTDRENQILKLLLEGDTNREIAIKLHISSNTVDVHRSNILKKTHSKSVSQLIKTAALSDYFS